MPSIAVIGNLIGDLVVGPLDRLPEFGQEAVVEERSLRSAGQAFNTAMALAALGETPCLVSNAGDDDVGRQILRDMESMGLGTDLVRIEPSTPTGLSIALLNSARDRAFVTHLGHLHHFTAGTVLAAWSSIAACRFFLFCGYGNLPAMRGESSVGLLKQARNAGLVTVLDTGWDPDGWTTGAREEVWAMLEETDIFIPNLEEARALTGQDDPAAAAAQLRSRGAGTIIVKLGPEGALCLTAAGTTHMPAIETQVADTVGAGDSFNAGVLYGLARDWSLEDAIRLGTAVASHVIAGHQPRYPSIEQALALGGAPAAGTR